MNNVLIVDTETTGLTPEDASCIEVGAVLFNVSLRSVVAQVSFLLPCLVNPAQSVNHIPAELTALSRDNKPAIDFFTHLLAQADAIVAHNTDFDRQWFGINPLPAIDKPWICTMSDIRWPASLGLKSRPSVVSLALAHGVPVWAAHRALTDCIYLAQVFERCSDLDAILTQALEPRFLCRAMVSYEDRELAKQAGFAWNQDGTKAWTRKLSKSEAEALPFQVQWIGK